MPPSARCAADQRKYREREMNADLDAVLVVAAHEALKVRVPTLAPLEDHPEARGLVDRVA